PHTKTNKVPVVFDVGCERSFITEEIVQQLGFEATPKEPLTIDGFGGTHITHCTSARVKLKMKRTDGRLFTMFANSIPRLVSEIAIARLTEKTLWRIRSTRNITLPTVMLKQQILVGADYSHKIFRGSASTKLPSGFHLIRTCLGDMISGQGRSNRHGTSSKIKLANRYCCNVASAKDELGKFSSQERRKNKSGRSQNVQRSRAKKASEYATPPQSVGRRKGDATDNKKQRICETPGRQESAGRRNGGRGRDQNQA
uniref:Peptidase aspartic putative domain-containing protein n=1 Tax=Parascaris univalens TaxID=6257 RepID=A0A915B887_PARUN